ncbi:MAG: hypothetical protein GY928_39720 [Colwellia sp.]|nr:hypothetical protein [Colwellia sp.]
MDESKATATVTSTESISFYMYHGRKLLTKSSFAKSPAPVLLSKSQRGPPPISFSNADFDQTSISKVSVSYPNFYAPRKLSHQYPPQAYPPNELLYVSGFNSSPAFNTDQQLRMITSVTGARFDHRGKIKVRVGRIYHSNGWKPDYENCFISPLHVETAQMARNIMKSLQKRVIYIDARNRETGQIARIRITFKWFDHRTRTKLHQKYQQHQRF